MTTYTEHSVSYTANGNKTISYISAGPSEGPLLIFIHGWPAIAKTWKPQLDAFAAKGFHVVAPDMPGYGKSTVTRRAEDYSLEILHVGLLALLKDVGKDRAVWIGHDWGAGVVSSFVSIHPEVCTGVVLLAVPYRIIELGLDALVETVNRDIYPVDKYPYGQWEYQAYYESNFEDATAYFEKDIPGLARALFSKGNPDTVGKPAFTATVKQAGGWFGGKEPPKAFHDIPFENMCIDEELYNEVVAALEKTGFWAADAYYSNHARNRELSLTKAINNGVLDVPLLFIGAEYDGVCDTANSSLAASMRKHCHKLTEVSIAAGHWVALEKPEETNNEISKWLRNELRL